MSIIHNIIPKSNFDFNYFNKVVSTNSEIKFEYRGENTFYYWIDKKSTRGLDLSIEDGLIEIRNTVLSNKYDYQLTNLLVSEIISLTNGLVLNEDEEQILDFPLFDDNKIIETEIHDCNTIQLLSRENNDIAIYGPIRKVHFGKRLHEQFKKLNEEQLKNKMFSLIIAVNYYIPDYEYGDIMQVGNSEEDTKILKLLTNKTNCIIDKYDFILLNTSEEKPIMITNEILNTILPSNWSLIDEYTIVAPIIEQEKWLKLLSDAKRYDMFEKFINN